MTDLVLARRFKRPWSWQITPPCLLAQPWWQWWHKLLTAIKFRGHGILSDNVTARLSVRYEQLNATGALSNDNKVRYGDLSTVCNVGLQDIGTIRAIRSLDLAVQSDFGK